MKDRPTRPGSPKAPALGSLFYEIGFKDKLPRGPIVVTYVYCGPVSGSGKRKAHLLVEFSRWWGLTSRGLPVRPDDGLTIPTLRHLIDGKQTWKEVRAWARKADLDSRVTGPGT
ncbi:MAG TPA: hypothetical protein VEN81_06570 [Planctomycetota bacterium]|nr:hypothetical protein [Planctomycetota bacterium]